VGTITITPETFTLVQFDADRITDRAAEIADRIGLDADVHLEVDESHPMNRLRVRSMAPIIVFAQGGAFEDLKHLGHMSEQNMTESLGRLLFRVKDRLDPGFAAVPADPDLSIQQMNAWDTYCLGRLARAGYRVAEPRWHYHFRLRQGFTDVADAAFARLWAADRLSWSDLEAVCVETAGARTAA
jgi:hypothetical protein